MVHDISRVFSHPPFLVLLCVPEVLHHTTEYNFILQLLFMAEDAKQLVRAKMDAIFKAGTNKISADRFKEIWHKFDDDGEFVTQTRLDKIFCLPLHLFYNSVNGGTIFYSFFYLFLFLLLVCHCSLLHANFYLVHLFLFHSIQGAADGT